MTEEIYTRQELLPSTIVPEAVVVGVGGTGTWTALFLGMSGTRKLHLMDSDSLELSNLNRLPFAPEVVSRPKTEVVEALILALRPGIEVYTYPNADEFTLAMTAGSHLFDCTDRYKTQLMLDKWCQKYHRHYIRVGYDGLHITVTDNVAQWSTDDSDEGGYEITPSWSVPAAMAACFGVAKAMLDPRIEVSKTIQELGGISDRINKRTNKPNPDIRT